MAGETWPWRVGDRVVCGRRDGDGQRLYGMQEPAHGAGAAHLSRPQGALDAHDETGDLELSDRGGLHRHERGPIDVVKRSAMECEVTALRRGVLMFYRCTSLLRLASR